MVHFALKMSLVLNPNDRATRQTERKAAAKRAAVPTMTRENEATFSTADGREYSARLVHLARNAVTFEAVNLAVTLRTSEVLSQFKIAVGGRVLYLGRAVVSNLIPTGESLICEAKLDDLGSDTAYFLPAPESVSNPAEAYDSFFKAWQNNYRISDEFKVLVADVRSYLTGVRHWLEELEFGLKDAGDQVAQEQVILDTVAPRIIAAFNGRHERFEEIICALPPEARGAHQDFVRSQWHGLFLSSPFGHRTYHKPLGYAGDYEMMNMIHRNQPEGRSLFEKLIHLLLVSQWPAKSVRNRVAHVGDNILNETARVARAGKTARILNVGCGPAREVQDFLPATQLSNQAEFTLIDFNEETLARSRCMNF
jgi:extracellular factor (EF) 3-hydroxypalmitic acid methyl ester biosynthesis protein